MKRILVVGTTKNKNVDLIYSLIPEFPQCEFIFIGEYYNLFNYKNFFSLSNLSDSDLILQYKQSHILLFPSLSEGFGMPIIESQYFGLPVITSKFEPMYSVAGNDSALFVNPKNKIEIISAINSLLPESDLRNLLINNGYKNCSKYYLSNILKKYQALYSNITNNF